MSPPTLLHTYTVVIRPRTLAYVTLNNRENTCTVINNVAKKYQQQNVHLVSTVSK